MRLAAFGASGNLGRRIVTEALIRGHHVTALVRRPGGLASTEGLSILGGDVRDASRVAEAVLAKDGVVSALGPSEFDQGVIDDVLPAGMANVVAAMYAAGVQRIVAVAESGLLQADSRTLRLEDPRYPAFLQPLVLEHRKAYEILVSSGLDWTLVCPPRMFAGERKGRYLVEADFFPGGGAGAVSLEDAAALIVGETEEGRFSGHRVGIAGT